MGKEDETKKRGKKRLSRPNLLERPRPRNPGHQFNLWTMGLQAILKRQNPMKLENKEVTAQLNWFFSSVFNCPCAKFSWWLPHSLNRGFVFRPSFGSTSVQCSGKEVNSSLDGLIYRFLHFVVLKARAEGWNSKGFPAQIKNDIFNAGFSVFMYFPRRRKLWQSGESRRESVLCENWDEGSWEQPGGILSIFIFWRPWRWRWASINVKNCRRLRRVWGTRN